MKVPNSIANITKELETAPCVVPDTTGGADLLGFPVAMSIESKTSVLVAGKLNRQSLKYFKMPPYPRQAAPGTLSLGGCGH